MKQVSLVLLIDREENKILLAMKKRGFGAGKWNGTGGKIEGEKGDRDVLDSALRETREEINVELDHVEKFGIFNFYNTHSDGVSCDLQAHLFISHKWTGEPEETEEMSPK